MEPERIQNELLIIATVTLVDLIKYRFFIVNLNGTNYMALSQSMAYISHNLTPPYGWGARPPPHRAQWSPMEPNGA